MPQAEMNPFAAKKVYRRHEAASNVPATMTQAMDETIGWQ
jgi:hypothetical protein